MSWPSFPHCNISHCVSVSVSVSVLSDQKVAAAKVARDAGNTHLTEEDYEDAVKQYSIAIQLDDTNHTSYSNRCSAFQGLESWHYAVADAQRVSRSLR